MVTEPGHRFGAPVPPWPSEVEEVRVDVALRVERLAWDSDFFGHQIGRVHLDGAEIGSVTSEMLAEVDDRARADGLECLYLTVDPIDTALTVEAQRAGYLLVEVAMDLKHPTSIIDVPSPSVATVRTGTPEDLDRLRPQFEVLAPWSRYAVDARFGLEAARRMHEAWTTRAAGPEPHRHLWVAEEDDGEIVGFATGSTLPDEIPRIDLIASIRAGSSSGRRIVEHVFDGFGDVASMGGPIAARNVVSLRFVLGMGYRVSTSRYLYHRWLTEG